MNHVEEFVTRMRQASVHEAAVRAFCHNYENLLAGHSGMIPEDAIERVTELPSWNDIAQVPGDAALLSATALVKLNGGLGTSMGLDRAKSLLPVRDGLTFLDLIAKQVLWLRERHQTPLRFMLMNSFSTSRDTRQFLARYSQLGTVDKMELLQNQVPKVEAASLRPVAWPENPNLEWCPPGHGDLYPSLLASGMLDQLLVEGVKVLFVSNSDNLGATLDLSLLRYFHDSGLGFLMEVAERTASDRKGGHLARRNGTFLLRESAQCPEPDQPAFQDIRKHRFFNTNNLWIRLDALKEKLDTFGGFMPLPMIRNVKPVDPRYQDSTPVIQLETAMGAAIELFDKAGAIVVPRARFAPVKTTSDLLALRSDAYELTEDWRLVLAEGNATLPPTLDLDPEHYRLVDQLDEKTAGGAPSLKACSKLTIRGPVFLSRRNVLRGEVTIINPGGEPRALPEGQHEHCRITLED